MVKHNMAAAVVVPVSFKRLPFKDALPSPKRRRTEATDTTRSNSASQPIEQEPKESILPSRQKRLPCPYSNCARVFNRPSLLDEHIRSHTGDRRFLCTYPGCDSAFQRQWHLDRHVKLKHTRDDRSNPSQEYDGNSDISNRIQEYAEGQQSRKGKYRCKHKCTEFPPCDEVFRKAVTLQRHIDKKHLRSGLFQCTRTNEALGLLCGEFFSTAKHLRSHELAAHESRPQRYCCAICPSDAGADGHSAQGFANERDLKSHIQSQHPLRCEVCSQVFRLAEGLREHMEARHADSSVALCRNHVCQEPGCDRSYTRKRNLTAHIRLCHKNTLQCGTFDLTSSKGIGNWDGENACGKVFTSKLGLEKHVRNSHLGQQTPTLGNKTKSARTTRKNGDSSLLSQLTGSGYVEESGREISCFVPGCKYRFLRLYDLEVHAAAVHKMNEADVPEAMATHEAQNGGRFWVGPDDNDISLACAANACPTQEGRRTGSVVRGFKDPNSAEEEQFDFFTNHVWNQSLVNAEGADWRNEPMSAIDPTLLEPSGSTEAAYKKMRRGHPEVLICSMAQRDQGYQKSSAS